ncbi:1,4-alpha-glucan branching protein GlgB [Streptomyces sp. KLOTTS4A1]|uniref:1,4-alpha-glucan branching protein GlgB n=1 Tax=Streptomyces sp. KLOTTS4A1 TaxID=3390996 RepID=UPI0039F617AF
MTAAVRPLGELDLHLLAEGHHRELWRVLGAHRDAHGVRFAVWAPNARAVRVVGDFNRWHGAAHPMRRSERSGVWELHIPGVPDRCAYQYEIDGADGRTRRKADPCARASQAAPGTASLVDSGGYVWGDEEWLARRGTGGPAHTQRLSVYEVHAGSWRAGLGYRELAAELPGYVRDLGFTHVELLPVAEHPFGGSWGYQITSYYAPTARLGTPDDFRHLVDALHQAGIGVLLDWVPAHFPKDDWALARFDGGPLYEHPDPRRAEHPDWGTLEFDYGRPEVRNFLISNALYWLQEFHIDGLRVDAVASMLYLDYSREPGTWTPNDHGGRENLDAVAFLRELNDTVHAEVPGALTIAEESTAWEGVTRPTGEGGLGFDLKWNMGWMHDTLAYLGEDPVHRAHHHTRMTFGMMYAYAESYVLALSHDEVVHLKGSLLTKMHGGDRWRKFAQLRAYLAFMWTHPGKQLLFMGQEFAQPGEWWHDGGLDWDALGGQRPDAHRHRGMRALVRDLNRVHRETPALWQRDGDPGGFSWIDPDDALRNVLSCIRYDHEGNPLVGVFNFSPVVHEDFLLALPRAGAWREVLNTDAGCYGGSGVGNLGTVRAVPVPHQGLPARAHAVIPPLAGLWLAPWHQEYTR